MGFVWIELLTALFHADAANDDRTAPLRKYVCVCTLSLLEWVGGTPGRTGPRKTARRAR